MDLKEHEERVIIDTIKDYNSIEDIPELIYAVLKEDYTFIVAEYDTFIDYGINENKAKQIKYIAIALEELAEEEL